MSAKNRRIQRKIAMVSRMDAQQNGYWKPEHMVIRNRVIANMIALGKKISRMGYADRGIAAVGAQRNAHGWK
jgi:hypothetical protein